MIVSTDAELLNCIHELYGHSKVSQYDLAMELQIPPRGASLLSQEAGYRRHKLKDPKNPVKLEDFIKEPYAEYIIRKKGYKHEDKS